MEPINQGQSIPTLNPAEQIQPIASSASGSKNISKLVWGVGIVLIGAGVMYGVNFYVTSSKRSSESEIPQTIMNTDQNNASKEQNLKNEFETVISI